MPTQEAKAHRVGEWASLRNTSPEIAEAIFEVAHYDEKLAEQIWEEGSDEVLALAFAKTDKDALVSGVNRRLSVKTSRTFISARSRPNLLKNPDCSGFFTLFRRLVDHLFKGLQRTESLIVNRAAVKRQGDPLRRGLQG